MANQYELLEMYKLMVEMADRVSQRRQTGNSFYLSINTAIVAGSSYLNAPNIGLQLAGIMICFIWLRNIATYKSLNSAKFHVIQQLEARLAASPYKDEWDFLKRSSNKSKYVPFNEVERFVPMIFIVFYLITPPLFNEITRFFSVITSKLVEMTLC